MPLLILVAGVLANQMHFSCSICCLRLCKRDQWPQFSTCCAGFPISTAVALSNIGVFGGGVGNFILNVKRRHPREDKPLIDWYGDHALGAALPGFLHY